MIHARFQRLSYSLSNPLLLSNFSVRLFSVTVRTTLSGTPAVISASISRETLTFDPIYLCIFNGANSPIVAIVSTELNQRSVGRAS